MNIASSAVSLPTLKLPGRIRSMHRGKDTRAKPSSALMLSSMTDAELIQACLDNGENAWKELVNRHGNLVYSVARGYGLPAVDAEDVFQNVFIIVLKRLKDLRNQTCFPAWLITITHHEAQRHRRKSGELSELDEMIEDESDAPLDICRRGERSELVRRALNRLEPRDRELLTSLVQEPPPSYDELAARLGMAVGSIGATRARCFKKLEAILMEMDSAPYC